VPRARSVEWSDASSDDDAVVAKKAIGALLKRFEAEVREPDGWESWYLTLALLAFHRRNYRTATRLTKTASIATVEQRCSQDIMKHPAVPLLKLQPSSKDYCPHPPGARSTEADPRLTVAQDRKNSARRAGFFYSRTRFAGRSVPEPHWRGEGYGGRSEQKDREARDNLYNASG
jgi:hypothetical protein